MLANVKKTAEKLSRRPVYDWNLKDECFDYECYYEYYKISDLVDVELEDEVNCKSNPALILDIRRPMKENQSQRYPFFLIAWHYDSEDANGYGLPWDIL